MSTIPCANCRGSGRVPMPPSYAETLSRVTHEWQATRVICGCQRGHTAVCNRLAWLHERGFVDRRGNGGRLGFEWRLRP